MHKRTRVLISASVGVSVCLAIAAYGRWWEPYHPVVEEVAVELPGLPRAADGYRVAFLADLHVREIGARERRVHQIVEEAQVDLVIVGGDFVDVPYWMNDYVRRAALACSLVAALPSSQGVVAVWGNNDIPDATRDIAAVRGIRVLENEQLGVPIPGGVLGVVGLDDPVTGRSSFANAFTPKPTPPYVAVAHSPDAFPEAVERGVPLLLAGHTHGGQIWLPPFLPGARRLLRLHRDTPAYRAGQYRVDHSTLYVTRGVGTSYLEFRLLCRPEVTLLTLRAPPADA